MARALILLVLVVSLVLGAGCSREEGGPVRFLVFGDPEELAAYRALVDAYGQEEPGADVQLVEASDRTDLIARLSTSIAGGSPPDLFLMNYRFYGQFAAKGAIEPMEERLRAADAFEASDFYLQALEAFQWRGEQLCLPQNVSSLVVYYNRDLFRRFRVPEPRAGWTWTELVAKAGLLTRDARGQVALGGDPDAGAVRPVIYGLGVEPTLIRLAPFVWSNGGELVDDERHPTRLTLNTPRARQALQSFLDLRAQGVVPTDEDVEAEDDESRFANGRLGMLLSSRRSTTTFRTIDELDWDVAALPRHRKPVGILHSDAYCMTAASKRKDAAWRFVEFALGPNGQRVVARTGRTVPSLISVSRSRAFLDPSQPPRRARVFLDAIPTIRQVPSISTWPEIEDATAGVLENGLYLGQPVDRVIRELDRVTRPLFARGESP
jgi:multiple sugar transport system substrate-binding protein